MAGKSSLGESDWMGQNLECRLNADKNPLLKKNYTIFHKKDHN